MAKFALKITLTIKGEKEEYLDFERIADMEEFLVGFIAGFIPANEPIKYKAKLENLINGIVIDKSN